MHHSESTRQGLPTGGIRMRSITKAIVAAAMTGGLMLGGVGAASATPTATPPTTGLSESMPSSHDCLVQDIHETLGDPIGTLETSAKKPMATLRDDVTCVASHL